MHAYKYNPWTQTEGGGIRSWGSGNDQGDVNGGEKETYMIL